VLSTGDELLEVDAPLVPGAIRDSNRLMLGALLAQAGAQVARSARVGDDPAAVAEAVRLAAPESDAIVTIGGVSAGDFDPVKLSLGAIGGVALWRVAMKPGRPQAFGSSEGRLFFGLPGNPASVACVFEVLVRPALRAMQGFTALDRPRLAARAERVIESRLGREDYVRVRLALRHGEWWAIPEGEQVSGHLIPQARGHALLVVPESAARLERGETAEALVLRWPEGGTT
jgi:molybdopterin molybdotransferase